MKTGTKSLLFGVHQFILHPLVVFLAWMLYYKRLPKFYQLCAIVTHDWGYLGLPNMDGDEGSNHPEKAANMWRFFGRFGEKVAGEILGHSGNYAGKYRVPQSKLFKADKLSVIFFSCYIYIIFSSLSGEIYEYMEISNWKRFKTKDKIQWFFMTTSKIMERVYNE